MPRPLKSPDRAVPLHAACAAQFASARRPRGCAASSGTPPHHRRRRPTPWQTWPSSRGAPDWARPWESKGRDQGPRLERSPPGAPVRGLDQLGVHFRMSLSGPHRLGLSLAQCLPSPDGKRVSNPAQTHSLAVLRRETLEQSWGATMPGRRAPFRGRWPPRWHRPRTRDEPALPDATAQRPATRQGLPRAVPECRSCAS